MKSRNDSVQQLLDAALDPSIGLPVMTSNDQPNQLNSNNMFGSLNSVPLSVDGTSNTGYHSIPTSSSFPSNQQINQMIDSSKDNNSFIPDEHQMMAGSSNIPLDNDSEIDENCHNPRKRSRRRKPVNCSFCRRRKLKCDRNQPCSNCIKRSIQGGCKYATEPSPGSSNNGGGAASVSTAENTPANSNTSSITNSMSSSAPSSSRTFNKSSAGFLPIPSAFGTSSMSSSNTISSMSNLFNMDFRSSDLGTPRLFDATPENTQKSLSTPGFSANLAHEAGSGGDGLKFNDGNNTYNADYVNPLLNFFANQSTGLEPFFPKSNATPVRSAPDDIGASVTKPSGAPFSSFKSPSDFAVQSYPAYTNQSVSSSNSVNTDGSVSSNQFPSYSPNFSTPGFNKPIDPSVSVTTSYSNHHTNALASSQSSIRRSQQYSNTRLHTRDGKSVSDSPISVSSLAPLYNTPSTNNKASDASSKDTKTQELQQRLDAMERMLITLVNQKADNSSPNTSPSNDPSPADSHTTCITSNSVSSNNNLPSSINRRTTSSVDFPSSQEPDDELMHSLRESLGMLKLDTSGKAVYHGATHWGSIVSEIDDVPHIIGKLKVGMQNMDEERISELDNSSRGFYHQDEGKPRKPRDIGTKENPASSSTGGCFNNNSFFATLQSSPNYMKVLEAIPQKAQCDFLIDRYFDSINCIYPIVNREAFKAEYRAFWADPPATEMGWMALFLGMLCLALQTYAPNLVAVELPLDPNSGHSSRTRIPTPEEVKSVFPEPFRENPEHVWNVWLEGAEYCANSWRLNFKPSLVNIRAMLVLMLCQHPSSFDFDWLDQSWIDISSIIRVAQTMGMHRDPQWFALDEYEREERRRIWYLLQYFDTYFTIIHGLPAVIRVDSMDVLPPIHCNLSEIAKECRYFDMDAYQPRDHNDTEVFLNRAKPCIDDKPLTEYTDASFFLARSHIVLLSNFIYNKTTSLQSPIVPYEQILELDSKIRKTFNNASKYLTESVLDDPPEQSDSVGSSERSSPSSFTTSGYSTHTAASTENSHKSSNSREFPTGLDKSMDATTMLFERFMYEMEYLKAITILHRKYSSRGLYNIKYRRSREEIVHSAERILKLYDWFFKSKAAEALRLRYTYIVLKIFSPSLMHSIVLLSLYSVGNYDSYSFDAARNLLKHINSACELCTELSNKTKDPLISRHMHFIFVLYCEAKREFEMSSAEREELKAERAQRKLLKRVDDYQKEIDSLLTGNAARNSSTALNQNGGERRTARREQFPGVPKAVNINYQSNYNTFIYDSWEYDRIRQYISSYQDDPDQFNELWKNGSSMDVDNLN